MNRGHGQRGQALVQFVVTALAFLIVFFGIIDSGRDVYTYDQVAFGARVGARWAIVNTPKPNSDCTTANGTCQTAIVNYILSKTALTPSKLTTTITFGGTPLNSSSACNAQPTPGCWIKIQLQYQFVYAFPMPAKTLSSSSQMVLATQY